MRAVAAAPRWSRVSWGRPRTRAASCSGPEGASAHVDDQLRLARDQLQDRLLRARARWQDDEPRARLRQGGAGVAGEDDLARDGNRTHALLRLPSSRPGYRPRFQGEV